MPIAEVGRRQEAWRSLQIADLTGGRYRAFAAALASRIVAQSQQPLARVMMGGMLTSAALIL